MFTVLYSCRIFVSCQRKTNAERRRGSLRPNGSHSHHVRERLQASVVMQRRSTEKQAQQATTLFRRSIQAHHGFPRWSWDSGFVLRLPDRNGISTTRARYWGDCISEVRQRGVEKGRRHHASHAPSSVIHRIRAREKGSADSTGKEKQSGSAGKEKQSGIEFDLQRETKTLKHSEVSGQPKIQRRSRVPKSFVIDFAPRKLQKFWCRVRSNSPYPFIEVLAQDRVAWAAALPLWLSHWGFGKSQPPGLWDRQLLLHPTADPSSASSPVSPLRQLGSSGHY